MYIDYRDKNKNTVTMFQNNSRGNKKSTPKKSILYQQFCIYIHADK